MLFLSKSHGSIKWGFFIIFTQKKRWLSFVLNVEQK